MDPLATPGELNVHLQREVDEDRAVQALQLASGAVRAFCGWDITAADTTFEVSGNGTVVVTLPTLILNTVTQVRINGTALEDTPLSYTFTRRGQLLRMAGWPNLATVEVDANHGYTQVPDLIKLITLEMAARTLANPENLTSAKVGAVTRTYATGGGDGGSKLTFLDQRLLERYRI